MVKRESNSLFLDYLIGNENKFADICEQVDGIDLKQPEVLDNISGVLNENRVLWSACLGELGWCLPKYKEKNLNLGGVIVDLKNKVSIEEIDFKISECFLEREIEAIIILTEGHLSESDKAKLQLAFSLYLKQEYFASALVLAGMIDSASINQALKTSSENDNISQCWQCYGKVIQKKFSGKYFDGTFPFNKPAKNDERGQATIEYFKSIKHNKCFDNEKDILIPLSFALLKFYDNSDWKDKKNSKIPSSINRHWLAHNMYDYNDITRPDCIKLFCMLYQITELYSMV